MRWAAALVLLAACGSSGGRTDVDAAAPAIDAAPAPDADPDFCAPYGAPGECMATGDCAALGKHSSIPGYCAGGADNQCCIVTPDPQNNPPMPAGYHGMQQADVTPAMTTWAVEILHDPVTYPMFATATRSFGALMVLARVEWHVPDGNNSAVHRGVTLYQPD